VARWSDGKTDFGWISIGLHWSAAAVVMALLFIGNSIRNPEGGMQDVMLRWHTTLALLFYVLLWGRIIWRFKVRHPARQAKQKAFSYAMGSYFHYLLLISIGAMLISGPLLAWSGGFSLRVWTVTLFHPAAGNASVFQVVRIVHVVGASVLGWGTLLHITAVIKHTVIDRDGAIDKIMAPLPAPSRAKDS
jgi:cytochrome b561